MKETDRGSEKMVQYEENNAPEMGLFCFGVIFYLANFNKSFTTGEETCIQLPRR